LPNELNTKKHDVVKNAYKKSITTNGLVRGVRGEPWAVASPDGGGPYKMIAAATLVQAFFEVEQDMPTNPQVVATKAAGLQGCLVLNHETPPEALRWLRDFHNSFHIGAPTSVVELLQDSGF
jgi:hypothetical protein